MRIPGETRPGAAGAVESEGGRRREAIRRALALEYLTVGWNLVEGGVALTAALRSGSVATLGFGVDSLVECASGLVLVWRLGAEHTGRVPAGRLAAIERRAQRLAGAALLLLAVYVALDGGATLWSAERPRFSTLGVGLLGLSLVVMPVLARRKRLVAHELGSDALVVDATQSAACAWLSFAALVGVALNGLLRWWWADPLGALVVAGLAAREGREAWKGEGCCRGRIACRAASSLRSAP